MTDNPSTPVVPVEPARLESDENLLSKLREPVDQGGYDGFSPDPLHISAANRIEGLLMALGTERTMHNAWRKRAEEAEAATLTPVPVVEAPSCPHCNHAPHKPGLCDFGLADGECPCDDSATTPSPVSREPLPEIAEKLARSLGHKMTCAFTGCTCGAGEEQAQALHEYENWKRAKPEVSREPISAEQLLKFLIDEGWHISDGIEYCSGEDEDAMKASAEKLAHSLTTQNEEK